MLKKDLNVTLKNLDLIFMQINAKNFKIDLHWGKRMVGSSPRLSLSHTRTHTDTCTRLVSGTLGLARPPSHN